MVCNFSLDKNTENGELLKKKNNHLKLKIYIMELQIQFEKSLVIAQFE